MEGLVARLDGVMRGYENPSVENAISRTYQAAGLLTTWTLDHLPPQFYPLCREIYVEELARRANSAKVFTNTHPVYIHDAARIAAVHRPDADFSRASRHYPPTRGWPAQMRADMAAVYLDSVSLR
jgi:hypothetical protein